MEALGLVVALHAARERFVKIYTRTGDEGRTGLFGRARVPKDHVRVEAYGTVDELNAELGRALADLDDAEIRGRLSTIQKDLFALGAVLSRAPSQGEEAAEASGPETPEVPRGRIEEMEAWIDGASGELEPLRHFVIPGGSIGAAALHRARTVCRRAERRVVSLAAEEPVDDGILPYLNRLSDLLFVFARLANRRRGVEDVLWRREGAGGEGGTGEAG